MLKIFRLSHLNPIKWLAQALGARRVVIRAAFNLLAALGLAVTAQTTAMAQSIDTSKIKQASEAIISSVQAISGIGVTLLLVIGLGLLMWGVALRHAF